MCSLVRLTGVTVQLRVDDVHFAVFLRFFRRPRRPRAGHQVVGTPVLLQANQVEWNGAELSGAAGRQEHHLVVVGDISVRAKGHSVKVNSLKPIDSVLRYTGSGTCEYKSHLQQLTQETLCFVDDFGEGSRAVTHLWFQRKSRSHEGGVTAHLLLH